MRMRISGLLALALAYAVAYAGPKIFPRYDCIVVVALAALVFHTCTHTSIESSPRARAFTIHATTQLLVVATLVHLWTLGYEGRNAVFGGILPWSDSRDFYNDALRLVHGVRFTDVSSRRPLFIAALAGLLKLSSGSLYASLAICAIAGGVAVASASLELWKSHGPKSAFLVWLVLFFFERRWAGFIQTEHFGLPFGVLAFILLWRAQDAKDDPKRASRLVFAGMFAITLAMMARAGPLFILPTLGGWAALSLAPRGRRIQFAVVASLACVLGVACHVVVLRVTGTGVTFSDYPAIAYGLIHGKDYTFLTEVHPALRSLPVAERVTESWRILVSESMAHPWLVVEGLARSLGALFVSPQGLFSHIWTNPDDRFLDDGAAVHDALEAHGPLGIAMLWQERAGTMSLLNAFVMGLFGIGFVGAWMWSAFVLFVRRRRDASLSLLRWVIFGVLASAPFTPPWITIAHQVETVAVAFIAALPAVILFGSPAQANADRSNSVQSLLRTDPIAFVAPAFMALLFGMIAWVRLTPLERPPTSACTMNDRLVHLYTGNVVSVENKRSMDFAGKALADLDESIPLLGRHNPELTTSLVPFLHPGTRYVMVFDGCDNDTKILVDDSGLLGGAIKRGGSPWIWLTAEELSSPRVLHVTSAPTLHADSRAP
ncbi:MAG: hypothetical protein FWD73_13915 [Polyangiaceae bacterium]|nr:hypothetical protein [Polyangiaceae bacterium]